MQQKIEQDVKSNVSNPNMKLGRPRTRAYIKQEAEDSKEYLKCALYSLVKTEPPSLEVSKYESTLPKRIKNKHCSICNITFMFVKSFLDHDLHFHKTKEIPIIDLKNLCCNICNRSYLSTVTYRRHMAKLNNIRIPLILPKPSKKSDIKDCVSCNLKCKTRSDYFKHLIKVHRMSGLESSTELRKPKHMKPTIDVLNLYCDVCNRKFSAKNIYMRHLVQLHEITLPKAYSKPTNFDHESLYCKVCDKGYKRKEDFTVHLQVIHHIAPSSRPNLIPNTYDRNNYCVACERTFTHRITYIKHLTTIHLEEKPELYQGKDCKSPSKRDLFCKKYCADCQKVFLSKRLYHIHMDRIHGIKPLIYLPNAGDVNNHCTLCDRTYYRSGSYRNHLVNVHNYSRPSIGPSKHTVNRSIEPVVDLLNMHCNACDRTYKTSQTYRKHMSIHHHMKFRPAKVSITGVNRNEVPVVDETGNHCTACDRVYKNRVSYKSHLYLIHGISIPKPGYKPPQINRDIIPDMNDKNNYCASCNRTLASRPGYKSHLDKIHNMKKKLEVKQEK